MRTYQRNHIRLLTSLNAYAALDQAGNDGACCSDKRCRTTFFQAPSQKMVNSIQTTGIPRAHSAEHRDGERPTQENVMKNAVFALFLVPF